MIVYGNAAQALSNFAAYSAFGGFPIFGPFEFGEAWANDDFNSSDHFNNWVKPYLDQVPDRKDLTYAAPSSTIKANAQKGYSYLKTESDMDSLAEAMLNSYTDELRAYINTADGLTKGSAHRSIGTEIARYDAFNAIQKMMKKFAQAPTELDTQRKKASSTAQGITSSLNQSGGNTVNPGGSVREGTPGTSIADLMAMQLQQQAAMIKQQTQQQVANQQLIAAQGAAGVAPAKPAGESPSWILPVAIGGGVLVVGGVIFALMKKKKSSMGGYRRHRRIRR